MRELVESFMLILQAALSSDLGAFIPAIFDFMNLYEGFKSFTDCAFAIQLMEWRFVGTVDIANGLDSTVRLIEIITIAPDSVLAKYGKTEMELPEFSEKIQALLDIIIRYLEITKSVQFL